MLLDSILKISILSVEIPDQYFIYNVRHLKGQQT
jgi:hypothetical protein